MADDSHKLDRSPAHWAWRTGLALVILCGLLLWMSGRNLLCPCGTIKLWHGSVMSSENSQHISDWYSFSHIIHGFIFYALCWRLKPNWPLGVRLLAAIFVECTWELLENSPLVIERYRQATIALDYYGDSVLNSLSDILFMCLGFFIASRLPWKATLGLALAMELLAGLLIHDNLTLNILMLVYPIEAVRHWQQSIVF